MPSLVAVATGLGYDVSIYRPVRGVIDVVLQERETWDVVAGEGHGELRSVEQQLRWAGQKADVLPSATGWPWTVRGRPRRGKESDQPQPAAGTSSPARCSSS